MANTAAAAAANGCARRDCSRRSTSGIVQKCADKATKDLQGATGLILAKLLAVCIAHKHDDPALQDSQAVVKHSKACGSRMRDTMR